MSNTKHIFWQRLLKLRKTFASHQAILLSSPSDIRYFSGFATLVPQEREALLVVSQHSVDLFYAHFSPFTPVEGIRATKGCSLTAVRKLFTELHAKHEVNEILVDESSLYVSEYHQLPEVTALSPLDRQAVWHLRVIKDSQEQATMTHAASIAKAVMRTVLSSLVVGQTELAICDSIERELKKAGSEAPAFPTIVAFGPHSALPHHQPTNTKLTANTVVLLDFGATVDGYKSDMTRTVWFGPKPSTKFKGVESVVKKAYDGALAIAGAPTSPTAKEIDHAARSIITEAGYGEQFIHTTGHGLGLDIHEPPSLNWNNELPIKSNSMITIEPGIYLEHEFGYRYENTIAITINGAKELTK